MDLFFQPFRYANGRPVDAFYKLNFLTLLSMDYSGFSTLDLHDVNLELCLIYVVEAGHLRNPLGKTRIRRSSSFAFAFQLSWHCLVQCYVRFVSVIWT